MAAFSTCNILNVYHKYFHKMAAMVSGDGYRPPIYHGMNIEGATNYICDIVGCFLPFLSPCLPLNR